MPISRVISRPETSSVPFRPGARNSRPPPVPLRRASKNSGRKAIRARSRSSSLAGAGEGADHVPEVVRDQARHDRVQVDHRQPAAGRLVQQDVVDLGVVVGHPLRHAPRRPGPPARRPTASAPGRTRSRPGARRPGCAVSRRDGVFQRREPARGVVEIGDRLVQPRRRAGPAAVAGSGRTPGPPRRPAPWSQRSRPHGSPRCRGRPARNCPRGPARSCRRPGRG